MTRFEETGGGLIEVPAGVADYCITLAGHVARHRDEHAAYHLANVAERYGAGMVCGRTVAEWRAEGDRLAEAARRLAALNLAPTITGEPVSTDPVPSAVYFGTAPSDLRIEWKGDGACRFRITTLAGHEAVSDVDPERVARLAAELAAGPPRRTS